VKGLWLEGDDAAFSIPWDDHAAPHVDSNPRDRTDVLLRLRRRGKRLKRLVKILCGKRSQEPLVMLRLQTWCLIGVLMLVHLAAFILVLNLINKQESLLDSAKAAGDTGAGPPCWPVAGCPATPRC
jgi:hypothetical protein